MPLSPRRSLISGAVRRFSVEPRFRILLHFLDARLTAWSQPALVALTLGSLMLAGSIDYLVGYKLPVLIFYLLPVSLAAWFTNRRFAAVVSVLSVGVWVAGEVSSGAIYKSEMILVWNATIVIVFFLMVAFLLDSFRVALAALDGRVQQRTATLTAEMAERDRLQKEFFEISEREQRRIGHDLHDGLGQHLAATALASKILEDDLQARQMTMQAGHAKRVVELAEQSIEMSRSLVRGISPVGIETGGLRVALAQLAAQMSGQFNLPCDFYWESSLSFDDPVASLHLYRIAQESISNAMRHGGASRVDVSLIHDDDRRLRLSVWDDGSGLPPPGNHSGEEQGLRMMAHRARMIGAKLEVLPALKRGTVVRCTMVDPSAIALPPAS